jgi:ubiquinone/menaquinone biosynthesis C-methylase UbiE
MPYLKEFFPDARLSGCDISAESIKQAQKDFPFCRFETIESPDDLRKFDGLIDCIFIANVFHHIPPDEHRVWIKALHRIMKKGALIAVFEMNMYNPLARRFTEKCPFDADAAFLAPSYCRKLTGDVFGNAKLAYTFFFPWRNTFFTAIEHKLFWLPLGANYCVTAQK